MAEEEEETPLLLPCSICNRTFIPLSLEKHRKICEKTTSKKRGIFNSFKQRLQGTGLEEFLPLSQININSTLNISESKWRQKHLDFVNTVRQARGIQGSGTEGRRCTPPSAGRRSSTSNETCPYCQRSFGIKAFDRHIEWCKEQKARIPKSTPPSQAKERLEARTKLNLNSTGCKSSTSNETCPYCQRSFGIKAFDRHIEWCKEQKARIPKSTPPSLAKERLEARTKYRAPLGSKTKRTTKEKYSSITNAVKPKSPAAYGGNIVKSPSVSIVKDDKGNQVSGLKPIKNKDVQHSPVTGSRRAETAPIRRASTPSRFKSSTKKQLSPLILGNSPVINKQKKGTPSIQRSVSNTELFGGAVNRRNRRNDSITNRERPEVYDPFLSAERQMQELLGPEEQWHSEETADTQRHQNQQSRTICLPISNELCTSPVSAFAKYSFFKSDDELASYLESLQDENENSELTCSKSEEKDSTAMLQNISLSVLPSATEQQTILKTEHNSELDSFQELHPVSLDNLDSDFEKDSIIMIENDTCSEVDTIDGSFDFSSFPFDMENLENEIERMVGKRKKSTKHRAKFESAALALQQSVSLYHPGPVVKPSEEFFPSSESEIKSSSHLFQKESFIHSLQDLNSTNSQEKASAMSEHVTSENGNYIDAVKADDTENEISCITDTQVNTACAAGSKISGDSAYSSLNRKSPSAEVTQQMFEICPEVPLELLEFNVDHHELPVVVSSEPVHEPEGPGTFVPPQDVSSSQFNSLSKLSNFCHNCGLRYPVVSAKFCCECGIKRLCI